MPVFDLVTRNNGKEDIDDINQRVIGATEAQVDTYIATLEAGGPTPALLINGAMAGNAIPDEMLLLYKLVYEKGNEVQHKTGLSLRKSLAQGGWTPYDGHG